MTLEEAVVKIEGYNKINLYDTMGNELVKNVTDNNICKFLNHNVIQIDLKLGYDDKGFDCINMNVYLEE